MATKKTEETYAGYIAIVGRPNVGKSTLLNAILGEKVSITSRKPQTTRQQILGIKTEGNRQAIYVDTPGLYHDKQKFSRRQLNRALERSAAQALKDVDLVLFVVEGLRWQEDDEWILTKLQRLNCPVVLVINKIDYLKPREALLTHIEKLSAKMPFKAIVPVSALRHDLGKLEEVVADFLPAQPFFFAPEQLTDKDERFFASEIIREKLTRLLGAELPYALNVMIEEFTVRDKILHISAVILVEKVGQKAIVIGKGGSKLKMVGSAARVDLEKQFEQKVFLRLWVKVKENWASNMKT